MTSDPYFDLPDPVRQSQFYSGVAVKRGLAWVIDTAITFALVLPILLMTAFVATFFLPLLFFTVGFAYRWMTIAGGSATWGMRMMAVELRNAGGQRLDGGEAFLHTLGYTVQWAFPVLQVVSIVTMLASERGQSLTDMVLGTVALNRRA
ncbi:RDD family protein [Thalassococcus sp. CAU 1522]|uniref:RDD family protein n=2 Tax=Thalassococcus arenae TaxID=2851652 RepID=A0ABS6NA66_9RHOB|nr:RDD family protein [Thalassococcus arenae]MBV2360897.1 RDD family protein [Thalassococcus arenae]